MENKTSSQIYNVRRSFFMVSKNSEEEKESDSLIEDHYVF